MSTPYAPGAAYRLASVTPPTLNPGYAVRNAAGRWVWSDTGPAEAGVVTLAGGRVGVDTAQSSTWRVVIGPTGSPVIY